MIRTNVKTLILLAALPFGGMPTAVHAQIDFDLEPIRYTATPAQDPVAKLQQRIDSGEVTLERDDEQGYLKSLLEHLEVSPTSQMLVFSKTSFQQRLISPRSPRALYFNDEVYVGYVPRGDVLELSAVDPQQGTIFYTLDQDAEQKPRFVRDRGNCTTCHASSRTHEVPGNLVRSVYPASSGMPHFGAGTFWTNHDSPLPERWGGWFVTGTHGRQRHMGNVYALDRHRPEQLDVEAGANRTTLEGLVDTSRYPTGHSDIVALMVLEHQTEMHNLLTHANYATRIAQHRLAGMNKALGRPEDYVSESTQRQIEHAAEDVLRYLLFTEEVELTDPIRGTSGFTEQFAALGPRDRQGRSLRQFDLQTRLFKYPCSYLIYSAAFDRLPPEVKSHLYRRLHEVLTGKDQSEEYARLTAADRQNILEILLETKQDLPDYWKNSPNAQ